MQNRVREPPEHLRLSQSASRPGGVKWENCFGVPECKPTGNPGIYHCRLAARCIMAWRTLESVGRGVGFSRFLLLAAGGGESRTASGPCPNRMFTNKRLRFLCQPTQEDRTRSNSLSTNSSARSSIARRDSAEIGEHLKDETLKRYFLAESLKRASFRGDLEEVLHQNGVHDIKESGTTIGTLQRAWGDLKAKLGGGDHTLLETAEQAEDAAKKTHMPTYSIKTFRYRSVN